MMSVVMQSVFMLSVVMQSVFMLSVVMLSVVAPLDNLRKLAYLVPMSAKESFVATTPGPML